MVGEDDDLSPSAMKVMREGETLAHKLPRQLAHGLLAVVGPRQRVVAAYPESADYERWSVL